MWLCGVVRAGGIVIYVICTVVQPADVSVVCCCVTIGCRKDEEAAEDENVDKRHCVCDVREDAPCTACEETGRLCGLHDGLYCSTCMKWFHAACVGGVISEGAGGKAITFPYQPPLVVPLQSPSQENDGVWHCPRCWEGVKSAKGGPCRWDKADIESRALRLGVKSLSANQATRYVATMRRKLGEDLTDRITDSVPRPYPTVKPLEPQVRRNLAMSGRRFEIEQLFVSVSSCDCCGATKPHVDDPFVDGNSTAAGPMTASGQHLRDQFYGAVHCKCKICLEQCEGGKFYVLQGRRKKHDMEVYHRVHSRHEGAAVDVPDCETDRVTERATGTSRHEGAAVGVPGCETDRVTERATGGVPPNNASLCYDCYMEGASMALARKFSAGNGYGKAVPRLVSPAPAYDMTSVMVPATPEELQKELHWVLGELTMGEEASIRRVSPLVSLVRLKHGNVGSKGTVTCMSQCTTGLVNILPRLPKECKTIVFRYDRNNNGTPGQFQCRRHYIARALTLLVATKADFWKDVQVSDTNLMAWPENGNLVDIADTVEAPEAEEVTMGDKGPAPLQNVATEGFEVAGLVRGNGESDAVSNVDAANGALEGLAAAGASIVGAAAEDGAAAGAGGVQPSVVGSTGKGAKASDGDGSHGLQTREGERILLEQNRVLVLGTFVDMRKTPWAWASAFPTLFPPTYVNGLWRVCGDPYGEPLGKMRDQKVTLTEWAKYCMWRSDGRPAQHPTFALVVHSVISQGQLHGQGQAYVKRSNVPPGMTLGEFAEQWGDIAKRKKFRDGLMHSLQNVRGTDQYWKNKFMDFTAGDYYLSYVKKKVRNKLGAVSRACRVR